MIAPHQGGGWDVNRPESDRDRQPGQFTTNGMGIQDGVVDRCQGPIVLQSRFKPLLLHSPPFHPT